MNKSLRFKMSMALMTFVVIIMLLSIGVANLFLEDFYIVGKQKALVDAYGQVKTIYQEMDWTSNTTETVETKDLESLMVQRSTSFNDNVVLNLEQLSQNQNLSIFIYYDVTLVSQNYFNQPVVGKNSYRLYSSMGSNVSNADKNMIYADFINAETGNRQQYSADSEAYKVYNVYVQRLGSSYLYLAAELPNQDHILIRASIEGMRESIQLSNRFFLYISLGVAFFGFVFMYFFTRNFSRPILELNDIAGKMCQMDFNTKYQVDRKDEIGVLGHSMNTLSETLEATLAELKEANRQLTRDLEKKEAVDQMRREFLSNVSHELKTPIALIQGYAEGLMDNINEDEESRQFYCEVIVDEANKMNNLVKKLLNLNQLESGNNHVQMTRFNVKELVSGILDSSDILFKQKEARLIFNSQEDVYAWGDTYMVEEVFTNYMTNALNHVGGEKHIEVTVTLEGEHARVSVFNTGLPIPEADIHNIWDKFYKVDKARTRAYGGSGVGLSIVKATMELLGQSYGVENHEDGVEFWFELDAANH